MKKKTDIESDLVKAIKSIGTRETAEACGVSYQAVQKWIKQDRLPRTEWTKETGYALKIAAMSGYKPNRIAPGAYIGRTNQPTAWSR